jgi:hypothetical protein
MKFIITLALLLFYSVSFSQWTRVRQLPSTDIFSLYHKDNVLYAGGKNLLYISRDKGRTWDSTNIIPQFSRLDNIIVYKNELYASSYSVGVYKSSDEGNTWQNITTGIFPFLSDFCEWRGDLYAATLGSSVFKLDPVRRDNWSSFSNGLSSLSANLNSIVGNSNTLVAGTNANGLYDYLPANSITWDERFLLGQIHPTEGMYDIITAHDSLFLSGYTGRFYMSEDNGLNWSLFGTSLPSNNTSLVNAKQALLLSRSVFDGTSFTTFFDDIKKDALQGSFFRFSSVPDHFTYKLDIVGDRLWDASSNGLFYLPLSDLPGISAADDTVVLSPLPIRFISFDVKCEGNKILISWKTAQEQNSSHFDIEESPDGNNWTVIGTLASSGNSATENSYSFTKNNPTQNNFYRIAEYDLDGRINYTGTIRSSCSTPDVFKLGPNPTSDKVIINLITDHESQAIIKLFDSKGSLVKEQRTTLLQGSNQFSVDLTSLARGVYQLQINWSNGLNKKSIQIMKM